MIERIEGNIVGVKDSSVLVRTGMMTIEILIPVCDVARWSDMAGETHTFHTLAYLESQGQGSSFIPRLIGFASAEDRAFFELFTKVKGIGYRKALRAMAMPPAALATAIAGRDVAMLKTLPEIGKRTAETIIAELHDKMNEFLDRFDAAHAGTAQTSGGATGSFPSIEVKGSSRRLALARDALAVLVQLGENRAVAAKWVDRVLSEDEALDTVEQIVNAAYRFRDG